MGPAMLSGMEKPYILKHQRTLAIKWYSRGPLMPTPDRNQRQRNMRQEQIRNRPGIQTFFGFGKAENRLGKGEQEKIIENALRNGIPRL